MNNTPALISVVRRMETLADPNRLRLLRLLERAELGVADLCDILQMPQSTVSRHLKMLVEGRWATSRRQGTNHLYRTLIDELAPEARRLYLLTREQSEGSTAITQDQLRLDRRLRDRRDGSQAFFAGAASQWDTLRTEMYGGEFLHDAALALLPDHWTIADLGCGTGELALRLAGQVKRVIAVDNSPAMLKAASRRLAGCPNVDVRRGELESLPIADDECDAATCVLVLSYLANPPDALRQAARAIKPGGRLVLVDLLPHDREAFRREMGQQHMGLAAEQLERWLTEAGFAEAVSRPLPPEPGVKGPALQQIVAKR